MVFSSMLQYTSITEDMVFEIIENTIRNGMMDKIIKKAICAE